MFDGVHMSSVSYVKLITWAVGFVVSLLILNVASGFLTDNRSPLDIAPVVRPLTERDKMLLMESLLSSTAVEPTSSPAILPDSAVSPRARAAVSEQTADPNDEHAAEKLQILESLNVN